MITLNKLKQAATAVRQYYTNFDVKVRSSIDILNLRAVPVSIDYNAPAREVISIDGSYSVLWRSPRYPIWVAAARTAMIHRRYDNENIKIREVANKYRDVLEVINTHEKTILSGDSMEVIDKDISDVDIQNFIHARSIKCDLETTLDIAQNHKNIAIFHDGSFAMINSKENSPRREVWNAIKLIIDACKENGNVFIGLSKDSGLRTINNITNDESLLEYYSRQHPNFTGYYLIDEGQTTGAGSCFARLHPRALKWMRLDFMYTPIMCIDEIIQLVACYSQVNDLPGTPFPPLTAHEVAVKVRQYKEIAEQQFMKILQKEGLTSNDIIAGLTDVNGNLLTGTFHQHLDKFTEVKKGKSPGAGTIN